MSEYTNEQVANFLFSNVDNFSVTPIYNVNNGLYNWHIEVEISADVCTADGDAIWQYIMSSKNKAVKKHNITATVL